ncbi:MAG: hypothetical protein A2X55_11205 [Nitrospirae bacterium GWB2_47_37]|nr:MAG: hypothetical protein A2Z82_01870 [Nitrospirae bacterium GWA2_46_11]OGW22709.1 MAG: hypothetical protein A2X55_11205 [Nitrospirae bacterium GWB2_47_37]
MTTTTEYKHIVKDDALLGGEPVIKGTRTSVRAIVENWRLGLSPEEIVIHMPHLTLSQVFEALSYYSDHQEEINECIEKNQIPADKIHPSLKK